MTRKQIKIARGEAKNIVREYLDHLDPVELENHIFEALIESLKINTNNVESLQKSGD